jgi:hypothetical protein
MTPQELLRLTPTSTEHVIGIKLDSGRVRVHSWGRKDSPYDSTDCGVIPQWRLKNWLWIEYRSLNPDRVVLCKKCWMG